MKTNGANEEIGAADLMDAAVMINRSIRDFNAIDGTYHAVCRDADGNIKWEDDIENLVTTVGKNLMLDTLLAGSGYTAAVYLGLTGGTPTPAAGDTMASHAGWTEVGATNAPAYTAPRKTPSWSAASGGSKATSSVGAFSFTSGGTVGGCFIVLGTGALSTIDNTGGVLFSVGAFTGGNKTVAASDTLTVTYSSTLT
jgi:hypothetical protein